MQSHLVKLIDPKTRSEKTISVNQDSYIQDVAEDQGIDLPYTCRVGDCFACAGKLVKGNVRQDKNILQSDELDAGFILLCRSWPTSGCEIETHQEEVLLNR